jgi:HD-like signal output (HDOD) protein
MGLFDLFGNKKQAEPAKKKASAPPARPVEHPAPAGEESSSPEDKKGLSAEHIQRFLPIRLLPPRVISYLAKQAKLTLHEAGQPIDFNDPAFADEAIYLLKGHLLINGNGNTLQIRSTDAKSTFPLALKAEGIRVVAKERTLLAHFPQELINGAEKMSPDGKHYGVQPEAELAEPAMFIELIDDAKAGNLELPSPPDLGVRIGRAIDKPEANSEDVARIIQLDPALTARMIQVANSPLYSGLGKITNCGTAVTRLGLSTTRNLVISFLLKNLFRNQSRVLQNAMDEVWHTSTRVAAISSVLAKITPKLDPGRAMLAGLIHQIGAIAVINDAKRHEELMEDPEALKQAVVRLSPEIGSIILDQWNFGQDLVDVVTNANNWMMDDSPKPTYTDLVLVAQLHAYVGTPRMKNLPRIDLVPAFHKLALGKLTPRLSVVILDQSSKDIDSVQHLLN